MTSSSTPLRGALRVLSATAILGATALVAQPVYAADSSFKDAVRKVAAQADRPDRSDNRSRNRESRSENRNRNTRSESRNRTRETQSRNNRDRDRARNDSRRRDTRNRTVRRSDSFSRNWPSSRSLFNTRSRNSYNAPSGWRSANYSSPWSSYTGRHKYRTNYRSGLGISFSFGSPGYSRYRWAPTQYSFYQPSFGSYSHYKRRTTCQRVLLDTQYRGHIKTVEVTQCSNPWDGTYIIQGSERFVGEYYY